MVDKNLIIKEFERIREIGYIKSRRSYDTGIGKTFEDYLGVDENNYKAPDFAGFEVKTQRAKTSSYLTLFTKSPTNPSKVNSYLRDTYGDRYETMPNLKRLHTSIFADKFNTYNGCYGFKIVNNRNDKKVVIQIKDLNNNTIDDTVYWSYSDLQTCLEKKLKALFFVNAESKTINGIEHFHYTKAEIFLNPSFEKLLKLIDDGKLMVDIRIGSYKSGKNLGKPHDHGTAFRIKPSDLVYLYDDCFVI